MKPGELFTNLYRMGPLHIGARCSFGYTIAFPFYPDPGALLEEVRVANSVLTIMAFRYQMPDNK
jgi:hypothetical protein